MQMFSFYCITDYCHLEKKKQNSQQDLSFVDVLYM